MLDTKHQICGHFHAHAGQLLYTVLFLISAKGVAAKHAMS